jgi:hypothetical protein
MKYIFSLLLAIMFVADAGASVSGNAVSSVENAEMVSAIATLEDDILILKAELLKCQKSKKGWVAATVVGSAGVVATGIAAGVQGAKISNLKEQQNNWGGQETRKKAELKKLQGKAE